MGNYKSLMSRLIALLLSVLLLCGCGVQDTLPTESTAMPEDTTSPEPTVPTLQKAEVNFYPAELTAEVALPEYDPNRQVYFTCHGWDYDFYPNSIMLDVSFAILTREKHAPEDIEISLPLESKYTVNLIYDDLLHFPEQIADNQSIYGGLPYFVYLTYLDVDWSQMADLWLAAEQAKLDIDAKFPEGYILNDPPAEVIALEQTIAQYESALFAYQADYRNLTADELSDYHCYLVSVTFDAKALVEETCQTMEITLADTTYTEEIGQIRIHTDNKIYNFATRGIEQYAYSSVFTQHNPWGGGLAFDGGHLFEAQDDLTLLGFRIEGMDAQVVGAQVTLSKNGYEGLSTWDDAYSSFPWDLSTPLEVADGCGVQLDLVISSSEWTQFEYGGFADIYLDYEVRGQQYSYMLPSNMTRSRPYWETIAIVFDNLDIASYYTDYYIPCGEFWRELIS